MDPTNRYPLTHIKFTENEQKKEKNNKKPISDSEREKLRKQFSAFLDMSIELNNVNEKLKSFDQGQ